MLLAEALIYRKELKAQLDYTGKRLTLVAVVREGKQPAEDPASLLAQFDEQLAEYKALITVIHKTNLVAQVTDGHTVTEAIVMRDMLDERIALLRKIDESVTERTTRERTSVFGAEASEPPFVPAVNIGALRKEVAALSKQRRLLDVQIQRANWTHELVEVIEG